MRKAVIAVLVGMLVVFLAACEPTQSSQDATHREQDKQNQTYEDLTTTQPAEGMAYSPTRDSLNKWAKAWEEEGKLSYVYVFAANGQEMGYYIFKGLPVSYCASLTPPDKIESTRNITSSAGPDVVTREAPALDGVYYGNCNYQQLFGFDAVSGTYYEFTGGGSFNYFLSDQPMTQFESMKPAGDATYDDVKNK